MRRWTLLLILLVTGNCILAQPDPAADLIALNTEIITQTDAFGVAQQLIVGDLQNKGRMAYADIEIYADVFDADNNPVGEAFGYIVDACGSAVLDFPIQPGQEKRFALTLDLYEEGVTIDKIEVLAEGTPVEPETDAITDYPGITPVTGKEVVSVEWEDSDTLRYGVGCDELIFTSYTWYRYEISAATGTPVENPNAAKLTETFIRQSEVMVVSKSRDIDPTLIDRSMLTFSPDGTQAAYQNDIHNLYTIQQDGSFRRTIHIYLNQFTLQGIIWTPRINFLAYYFGAYGEPVRYVTVNGRGGLISRVIAESLPSVIVPGVNYNAEQVYIAGTFSVDDREVTGYFVRDVRRNTPPQLLFEADNLPGNNYPAPLYYLKDDTTRYLYIVRPVQDKNVLQCYHLEDGTLDTLTPLPLILATDERAWTWLSPDGNTLALAASGDHSGLWLIDLRAYPECR